MPHHARHWPTWLTSMLPVLAGSSVACGATNATPARPNILCITWEDTSLRFGCYGDRLAHTPVIDRLAAEGVRFTQAFATAPVCSPSRSAIISARWPVALGSQHHRTQVALPPGLRCFPALLRDAGYFCYNVSKTDYNFSAPTDTWDVCAAPCDWRNRRPGQPFFGVHNFTETHQGATMVATVAAQQRALLPAAHRLAPARAPVPPYYPDTPRVREHIAALYNNIALADLRTGALLQRLRDDGLDRDTIVIFYADHGDGLPRAKLHLYQAGLRVPLIIRIPARCRDRTTPMPGSTCAELVTLMDLGPTILSLAGVAPPPGLHGRAVLGPYAAHAPPFIVAARDRIEAVPYLQRSLYDGRWRYLRTFRPAIEPHAPMLYHEDDPLLHDLRALYRAGAWRGPHTAWLAPASPPEELYDTRDDPHCLRNRAGEPAQQERLARCRAALRQWQHDVNDLGLLPESLCGAWAHIHGCPANIPPALLQTLPALATAWHDASNATALLLPALTSSNAAARYWAVVGLGLAHASNHSAAITARLQDPVPAVACAAVASLHSLGVTTPATLAVLRDILLHNKGERLAAIDTARRMGPAAAPLAPALRQLLTYAAPDDVAAAYVPSAATFALEAIVIR